MHTGLHDPPVGSKRGGNWREREDRGVGNDLSPVRRHQWAPHGVAMSGVECQPFQRGREGKMGARRTVGRRGRGYGGGVGAKTASPTNRQPTMNEGCRL